MKLLTPLLLSSCMVVHDDLPSQDKDRCATEMAQVESICEQADVVGSNDNTELKNAIKHVKECLGNVKVICSETDESKILTYEATP